METMRIEEEPPIGDKIQHIETFVEFEVLPTSKALKLYATLSSTSTTNCFAMMFKWKLNNCMINCIDCLRRYNGTLIK